jgi:DNA-binding response OmpR family regulator
MNILIFENEKVEVEGAFEAVNIEYYDSILKFKYFASSQAIGDINNVKDYALVIIDLSLSVKSELDGYHLIKEILKVDGHPNLIILTGALETTVNQRIDELGLPYLPIIKKPVDIDDIFKKISPLL